ncbi:hypothetical protein BpHYR1_011255 [Brachionus plicatilis]|uniref:Uncharacterized protein n=1 Tax=Brachionus plicatilis TaxID=10195 RepID=A0A3M7RD55_BRAPC|nr:hypothetical protein BpHYR1_011255 [Brachionus plicatilis]
MSVSFICSHRITERGTAGVEQKTPNLTPGLWPAENTLGQLEPITSTRHLERLSESSNHLSLIFTKLDLVGTVENALEAKFKLNL